MFQYRMAPLLLFGYLVYHKSLIKRKTTDKCTLCNTKEDIPHVLYECIHAKTIWNKLNLSESLYILLMR